MDQSEAKNQKPKVKRRLTFGFWPLAFGLILGSALRLAALPLPGTGDVDIWKLWSFGARHDLTGVYGVGGSPPERRLLHWQGAENTVNYPPVAMAELAVVGRLYEVRHPFFEDSSSLTAAVKLPGVAAEALLIALALTWGRRRFGADAASRAARVLALNPAMLLTGSVLGYIDALAAVPVVVALFAAWAGAGWLAGALATIAVLTKPQAIFVCPVIGVALVAAGYRLQAAGNTSARGLRPPLQAVAAAFFVSAAVLLPYALRGAWPNLTQALGRLATHDMLSANAANVWWIFTWVLRVLDVAGEWGWRGALMQETKILAISRAIALGYPNARTIGSVLVAAACAWAAWQARRAASAAALAALAGWSAWAYALLAAQVHENHLYLAVPFFIAAAALDRRYAAAMWWVSGIFTLNLLLFYGLGRGMPWPVERRWTGIDASVLLAVVNVAVFIWATVRLRRQA
jgi:hypothetical protein